MNFIKKWFGKSKIKQRSEPQEKPLQTSKDPEMIRVHDEYGREMMITRSDWLSNVLLGNLEAKKDNPDELYVLLLGAINDGFEEDVLDHAKFLFETDPIKERATCLFAIVLIKIGDLDKAEAVLNQTISEIGKTGTLLTNLAKVHSSRGHSQLAEEVLWSAIELDPNLDNGLDWYAAMHYERGGKPAYLAAYSRANELSGAWRPNLWLARGALESGQLDEALKYYQRLFSVNEAPNAQTLQQITGDLGLNGYLKEAIAVVEPKFDIERHGFEVGNNLIKAHIDLGELDKAQDLLNLHFAQKRPDWRDGLLYWQNQLDKLHQEHNSADTTTTPKISLISIDQPAWLHKLENSCTRLNLKQDDTFVVLTTAASCSLGIQENQTVAQPATVEGSLCRGFPMTLCDKLNLQSNATATMLLPVAEQRGFAFFSRKYDEDWAKQLTQAQQCNLLLLPHLNAIDDTWMFEVDIFDSKQSRIVKSFTKEFNRKIPSHALKGLVYEISAFIRKKYELKNTESLIDFETISSRYFGHYVDANESCLALSLACDLENGSGLLYGERNIFEKLLHLCIEEPGCDIYKFMFLSALAKNKAYNAEIYLEYQQKAEKMLSQIPSKPEIAELLNDEIRHLYS